MDLMNTPNQLMKLQVIFNECVCPTSAFLADAPPEDLQITAKVGSITARDIPFQNNRVSNQWGQDCGSYSVRLEPELPDLLLLQSVGRVYTDRIRLGPASQSQVGVYNVKMIIEQNLEAGDGYTLP